MSNESSSTDLLKKKKKVFLPWQKARELCMPDEFNDTVHESVTNRMDFDLDEGSSLGIDLFCEGCDDQPHLHLKVCFNIWHTQVMLE